MPRRVNPIMLLGLIAALVLSIAIFAAARTGGTGGGSPDAALGAAMGQVGTPYGFGTDGPGTFSCTGLVRYALRSAGVDPNAPWDHMAYLSAYPTHDKPVPGDVVVYPDGVAMYTGNDTVVMANEVDGVVGTYPMYGVGTPIGFANPYGGTLDPAASDPAAVDPALADPALTDPALAEPALTDPALAEPAVVDPAITDEAAVDPTLDDPAFVDPAFVDPAFVDPAATDPTLVDPAAVDPAML